MVVRFNHDLDVEVAVLSGDIVGSQRIDRLDGVRNTIIEAGRRLDEAWPGLVVGGPQFFRGDAWQLVLRRPKMALRVAIYLRARLRALEEPADTRIAIGLGDAEHIDPKEVSLSLGEAFTLSGRALDEMGRRRAIRLSVPDRLKHQTFWLPPILSLCGAIIGRWKPRQAEAVALMLIENGRTQEQLARDVKVSRQALSKALLSAGWPAIDEAITVVEGKWW